MTTLAEELAPTQLLRAWKGRQHKWVVYHELSRHLSPLWDCERTAMAVKILEMETRTRGPLIERHDTAGYDLQYSLTPAGRQVLERMLAS